MARAPRERTRQRCVMTTDSEWEMIGALAGRAGLSISASSSNARSNPGTPCPEAEAPSGLPPEVRRRTALATLVLAGSRSGGWPTPGPRRSGTTSSPGRARGSTRNSTWGIRDRGGRDGPGVSAA